MNNIRIVILIYLFLTGLKSNGQSISDISVKICDSIKSHKAIDSDAIILQQADIYSKFLEEYIMVKKNNYDFSNWKNEINSTNYKLIRELNKTCETFKIKSCTILPFTNLIEIDSIFSVEQSKKINDISKEIRNKNKMEIIILSIDELYTDIDIQNFSINKLTEWKIGGVFEKGGIIIVFSKKLREITIATTEIAMKYLTNKDCDKLIAEIMIPNFKKDNYYDGIYKSLIEIKNIIK